MSIQALDNIPSRLEKEPVVDAIISIRFEPVRKNFVDVMPGVLMHSLGLNKLETSRFPHSDFTQEIRDISGLKYAPDTRIDLEDFFILIGSHSLALGSKLPYVGGKVLKEKFLEIFHIANKIEWINEIDVLSIKYVDILEGIDNKELISLTNISLTLKDEEITSKPFKIETEIEKYNHNHVLNITSPIEINISIKNEEHTKKTFGLLIETESTYEEKIEQPAEHLKEILDSLHSSNKKIFFSYLSEKGLERLGAVYE